MPRLKGKVAIVTGGGSGFGEGIARRFAAEGARVTVVDVRADQARRVAEAIGDAAMAIEADVASGEAVEHAVTRTIEAFAIPDIVVNNAGVTHRNRPILEVDEATFERIFAVNVKSIFHMVRAVVPPMRENGGGVMLNVGSTAGIRPRPGLTWYNASKGAVNLVSKSLAVELAPWKIRVNALCPVMGRFPGGCTDAHRDGNAERLHGRRRHAGESCAVSRDDSTRTAVAAGRHRCGGAVPRLRRSLVHHRSRAAG